MIGNFVNLAFKTFSVCQWRILIIIIVLYVVYMYSIWKIFNLTLPKDFNRSSRFFWGLLLPCKLFVSTFYFKTTQIQFLCISDFHKWFPVYPALARRILYWQTSKRLNNSILQLWPDLRKPDIMTHFSKSRFLHKWIP